MLVWSRKGGHTGISPAGTKCSIYQLTGMEGPHTSTADKAEKDKGCMGWGNNDQIVWKGESQDGHLLRKCRWFAHGSTAENILSCCLDGYVRGGPGVCGKEGVYCIQMDVEKPDDPPTDEEVLHIFDKLFHHGYNLGGIIVFRLTGAITNCSSNHPLCPGQIGTKMCKNIRQFAAHKDCIDYELVAYHSEQLLEALFKKLGNDAPLHDDYTRAVHDALIAVRDYVNTQSDAGNHEYEQLVEVANKIVTGSSRTTNSNNRGAGSRATRGTNRAAGSQQNRIPSGSHPFELPYLQNRSLPPSSSAAIPFALPGQWHSGYPHMWNNQYDGTYQYDGNTYWWQSPHYMATTTTTTMESTQQCWGYPYYAEPQQPPPQAPDVPRPSKERTNSSGHRSTNWSDISSTSSQSGISRSTSERTLNDGEEPQESGAQKPMQTCGWPPTEGL